MKPTTRVGGAADVDPLSDEDRRTLLRLARQTLTQYIAHGSRPEYRVDSPALRQQRASFVTLRRKDSGELRGCRGECFARQSLVDSVVDMTVASATDDPRFPPVTADEVPSLRIEISALGPMCPIQPEAVEVGRHGLMIVRGSQLGLLLPQAPVSYGWDRVEYLEKLCRKARLPSHGWERDDVVLFGFESEVWGEET